jgi:hypothetical protein
MRTGCKTLATIAFFLLAASTPTLAKDDFDFDGYVCSDFLADLGRPANSGKLVKALMTIAYFAGYTSKEKGTASAEALKEASRTLGTACRRAPSAKVLTTNR